MRFEDDVIEAVKTRAPNGVIFEEDEIVAALTTVAGRDYYWYATRTFASPVERAAAQELVARNPQPARLSSWQSFLAGLGISPRSS